MPTKCPPQVVESLLAYWHLRRPPGGFLTAVLSNDLARACRSADPGNLAALASIVGFCWEQLPADAWGSPAKVRAWLDGP